MKPVTLTLQDDEAKAIRAALQAVLRDPQATNLIYATKAQARSARRAAKKIEWASQKGPSQ
jgi:hypothetical protein